MTKKLLDLRKSPLSGPTWEVTCPNGDEVFWVDELGLYELGLQPRCYCGMYYEIRVIANA